MHMPTQVRMHLRMAIRLLKGLRFRVRSECFAVLGLPACGTHTETSLMHSLFYHREGTARPSLCSAAVCAKHTKV